MKNVKLAREAGSSNQETMEKSEKYLSSVTQKNIFIKKQVFYKEETGLFHTDAVGKQAYITLMVFQLIKVLWPEAFWNLILHFPYEQKFSVH